MGIFNFWRRPSTEQPRDRSGRFAANTEDARGINAMNKSMVQLTETMKAAYGLVDAVNDGALKQLNTRMEFQDTMLNSAQIDGETGELDFQDILAQFVIQNPQVIQALVEKFTGKPVQVNPPVPPAAPSNPPTAQNNAITPRDGAVDEQGGQFASYINKLALLPSAAYTKGNIDKMLDAQKVDKQKFAKVIKNLGKAYA